MAKMVNFVIYILTQFLKVKGPTNLKVPRAHESHNSALLVVGSWLIYIDHKFCIYGPNHVDCTSLTCPWLQRPNHKGYILFKNKILLSKF